MYALILRRNQGQELPIPYEEMARRFGAWTGALQQQGVVEDVQRFKPADEAATLRHQEGQVVSEGRYAAAEDVIGYYLLNVENLAAARALAVDCPILEAGGSVEIRQTEAFGPQADPV